MLILLILVNYYQYLLILVNTIPSLLILIYFIDNCQLYCKYLSIIVKKIIKIAKIVEIVNTC